MNIDSENNEYILHDLDDTHLLINENKVSDLKRRLDDVGTLVAQPLFSNVANYPV